MQLLLVAVMVVFGRGKEIRLAHCLDIKSTIKDHKGSSEHGVINIRVFMLQDDCFWLTSWKPTLPVCDKLRCLEASLDASCSPWRPSTSCDRASPPPQPGWGLRHATRSSPCNKDNFAAQAHLKCDETKYKGRLHHPTWARSPSWRSSNSMWWVPPPNNPKEPHAMPSNLRPVESKKNVQKVQPCRVYADSWVTTSCHMPTFHFPDFKHVQRFKKGIRYSF